MAAMRSWWTWFFAPLRHCASYFHLPARRLTGSASVVLDGNVIRCCTADNEIWRLPLADLAIFGEHTNDSGPYDVDYYFVFIATDERAYVVSFYAEGRERFLNAFRGRFGVPLVCKLVGETDLASNVLWPQDLAGQPLYDFSDWLRHGGDQVPYSPQVLSKLRSLKEALIAGGTRFKTL